MSGAAGQGVSATSSPASGAAASGSAQIQGLSAVLEMMKLKRDFDKLDLENKKTQEETRSVEISNQIAEAFGMQKASLEVSKLGQEISLLVSQIGASDAQKALYQMETALAASHKEGADLENELRKWEKTFIDRYHVSSSLAGDLIRAAASLASSGLNLLAARNVLSGSVKKTQPNTYSVPRGSSTTFKGNKRMSTREAGARGWSISYADPPVFN